MNTAATENERRRKRLISLLWIVVMLNMAFADILTFITPGSLRQMMSGYAGEMKITSAMLAVFAVLIEVPIAMIFLSVVLKRGVNRVLNIAASVITAAFVIGGGSTTAHYIILAGVELLCMVSVIVLSIRWPKEGTKAEGHT